MFIIADDLSGAAESVGLVAGVEADGRLRRPARILLAPPGEVGGAEVVALDTRARDRSEVAAVGAVLEALGAVPPGVTPFLKYDSLLRGHVGVELAAASSAGPVLFSPAVPELGRTVVDGVGRVVGVTLPASGLWSLERRRPPARVSDLFARGVAEQIDLATVRGDQLAARLSSLGPGRVACCDAVDRDDLRRLVAAAQRAGARLAGSSSLATALAASSPPLPVPAWVPPRPRRLARLGLIGSASPRVETQVAELERCGEVVVRSSVRGLPSIRVADHDMTVVVQDRLDPGSSAEVLAGLAGLAVAAGSRHLVLAGGGTARAVLDALGVTSLAAVSTPHLGAVAAVTDDGRMVVTRPGSFGPDTSLVEMGNAVDALLGATQEVSP